MRVDVPFAVVSADFRVASTLWRSRLALDEGERQRLFAELRGQGVSAFVQVATCNRTEWIAVGDNPDWVGQLLQSEAISRWLESAEPLPHPPRVCVGDEAVRHILRVSIGLESFARGERQIAGQVHRAFMLARDEGTACGIANVLGTIVGRTVARTSQLTGFRSGKAGVHREVAAWLHRARPQRGRAMVIGMGVIGKAIAGALQSEGWQVLPVNRTVPDGAAWTPLAEVSGGRAPQVDAVVIATGAQRPVWRAADIPATWGAVPLIDVGSPAQADPALIDHPGVALVDLDTLLGGPGSDATPAAVEAAEAEVEAGLDELRRALGKRRLREIVDESRRRYETLAWRELPELLERHGLPAGAPGRGALEGALRDLFRDYAHAVLDAVERQSAKEAP